MNSSKTYKPKLVVVTSRFPYPLEKGDKLRAYYQIIELAKEYNVYLLAISEIEIEKEWLLELNKYCKEISIFRLGKIQKGLNTLLQVFTNKPFQIGYFTSIRIKKEINKRLRDLKPDHIYCQLIRPAEYVKNYHACGKTIDYMDALSKGIERRIEKASWYQKPLFKIEYERLRNYEHKIFDYFEHHSIITEQDKSMIFHQERNSIEVIPNGIAPSFFEYEKERTINTDLVFTGNMSYPPNVEACKYLATKIMPKVPQLKLHIRGANPSVQVQSLVNKNVLVSGWIDDIRDAYAEAKIFIAPMQIGTGLQNKLLEAMAMGLPCITTSLANNALGAVHGESILIANSPSEFINAIELLMNDDELYQKIKEEARKFVNVNFNWESSSKRLIDLMKS